jgi:crotonobetainyl-CoA:carnitine CoA-transferase CaiB-like acyl-CoA transferase
MLETVFHSRTTADWMARLEEAGVPAGPVHTIDQVFRDPQVLSRGMLLPVNHPVLGPLQLAGSPFRRASPNMPPCLPPPLLGQHTDDILRDVLGLDDGAIRLHRQAGTI